ncbi:MAG: hypothetical protein MUF62_11500, partial [Chitinophagaceae bacterium]|nr:hypothetical protein [Chitinophagaceae bacterium]
MPNAEKEKAQSLDPQSRRGGAEASPHSGSAAGQPSPYSKPGPGSQQANRGFLLWSVANSF